MIITLLFYTRQDEVTLRADKIFRHKLNADSKDDVLVYNETDDTFNVSVQQRKVKKIHRNQFRKYFNDGIPNFEF